MVNKLSHVSSPSTVSASLSNSTRIFAAVSLNLTAETSGALTYTILLTTTNDDVAVGIIEETKAVEDVETVEDSAIKQCDVSKHNSRSVFILKPLGQQAS